ncbi:hypothetical protein ICR95_28060 (plasmid) [Priestia megaterium]|uniref:hypothetical protein n=1 Tax=Priestia megaterium TaxID=1404 RepID=UPI00196B152F|nr:hypothetical protein [Priestia megaterium]QSF36397.1 hypothetical protein ICR95_28060 [Priestia megaterium]
MDSQEMFNVEENNFLNGMYLVIIIDELEKCTVEQLAMVLYLYRFPNIVENFLSSNEKISYLELHSHAELNNLDTVFLSPFLLDKYNKKFINAFKELLARDIIEIKNQVVTLNKSMKNELQNLHDMNINTVKNKMRYLAKIVKRNSIKEINKKMERIVGEK